MLSSSLISFFNQKFAQEQNTPYYHPLRLEQGKVSAFCNQKRLDSSITPVYDIDRPQLAIGYIGQSLTVTDTALSNGVIVNNPISHFDRLSRTVQILNALELMNTRSHFFALEISPRHIFALKSGHGSYFKDVVNACGLQTRNIICFLTLYGVYDAHHENLLLEGMLNYRALGYKVAINVGYLLSSNTILDFIQHLAPDYLLINAPAYGYSSFELKQSLLRDLHYLKQMLTRAETKLIMRDIQEPGQAFLAQ